MSSDDTSSASESAVRFQKEATFVVTDNERSSPSLCDDLRRRKAIALAKANARHAVKMDLAHNHSHRHSKIHKNFTDQGGGHSSKRFHRAYIESTGSELYNSRGEKICFQWKTTDAFTRHHGSGVVPVVQKLYEYKKQRLKSKSFESRKSAPNKKSTSSKIGSRREISLKRSKTVDTTVSEHESSFALSSSKRLPTRVAFINNDNAVSENKNADSVCALTGSKHCNQVKKPYPLSVISETSNDTFGKDTFQTHNKNCRPIKTQSTKAFSLSDPVSSANITQSPEILTPLSPAAAASHLQVDCVNDSSKVPWKYSNKILFEPKQGNLTNEIQNSTHSSQNVQSVPESHSFLQTPLKTVIQLETKFEIECASKNINFQHESSSQELKTNKGDFHPTESSLEILPETSLNIYVRTSKSQTEPALNGKIKTEPAYHDKSKVTNNSAIGCLHQNDNLQPLNSSLLSVQDSAVKKDTTAGFETTKSNTKTGIKQDHAPYSSDGPHGQQAQQTVEDISEINAIIKSNTDTEQKNSRSTGHVRVSDSSVNGINVIKPKGYISDHKGTYSKKEITDSGLRRNSNDQNIALSVSRGLKFIKAEPKKPDKHNNKKGHTASPVNVSGHVSRKEKGISGDLKDADVKSTSKAKPSFQDHGSKMSIHKHIRTTSKLPTWDGGHVVSSDQTDMAVIVPKHRIDHLRCVNKSNGKGKGLGILQFEHTLVEQGRQRCVTELNQATTGVASHALVTSLQDAEVSMATSGDNQNSGTGGERKKPGLDMKDSLLLVAVSVNNRGLNEDETCEDKTCEDETCEDEIKRCDPPPTPSNGEKHRPSRDEHSSDTLRLHNTSDIIPARNPGDLMVTDKHYHNMNCGCQSITDAKANDTLNSDSFDFQKSDETKSTTPCINRFKNVSNLALGELHLSDSVDEKGPVVTNDISSRKSKELRSLKCGIENTDFGSAEKTKENIQYTSKSNGNRLQINVAVGANNGPGVEKERGHCNSCEEESIAGHESIREGKVIYHDLHAAAISAAVIRESKVPADDDQITVAEITCGNGSRSNDQRSDLSVTETLQNTANNDITENIRQSKDSVFTVADNVRSIVGDNSQCSHKADKEANHTANCSKTTVKGDDKDKDWFLTSKTRKGKEQKRQTLSLHTQKMEFRDLPKKPMAKTNMMQQVQPKFNSSVLDNRGPQTGSFLASHKNDSLQGIHEDETDQNRPVSNSEMVRPDSSRPKTAGLSAYAPCHQNDDLWSVNTGNGDDEDDDDDDDQIQFIDGEQDFYKVFGYNEETAAILNATKVYPVKDSQATFVTSAEQSGYSGQRTKEFYTGSGTIPNYSVHNSSIFNSNIENSKNHTNRNTHNGDFHFSRTNTLLKRNDHSKVSKTNSTVHSENSFTKASSNDYKHSVTGNQGNANIHRKLNKSHLESITSHAIEAHPVVNNPLLLESSIIKGSRKIEPFLPNEQMAVVLAKNNNDELTLKKSDQEHRELKKQNTIPGFHMIPALSIANAASSNATHMSRTLPGDNHNLEISQKKGRRRIHSDVDISTTNNDIAATTSERHSERISTSQNEHAFSSREDTNQGSKDSKSHHVALRNQLATEKHINHTRSHRHANNGIISFHKSLTQMSSINDKMASTRTKDQGDHRHDISKETAKASTLRIKENTSYLEQTAQNPYLNAADRIMSRISDTEHLICSRSEVYNGTVSQDRFQERSSGTSGLNSPLRRMSHPVDTRIKNTHPSSYYVTRPRKLKPILQACELKQEQQ